MDFLRRCSPTRAAAVETGDGELCSESQLIGPFEKQQNPNQYKTSQSAGWHALDMGRSMTTSVYLGVSPYFTVHIIDPN